VKAYVVLALGLGLFTPFEVLGQAKEIVRVLSLLVQDAGQASRLAQALSANQTAAAWLLARAGRPGSPLVPLDRAEADRLLSILESGSDPALYARMDSLLRPKSPKERLPSGEGLPSSVMESFSSEYNRILEGRSLRERVLFGGVLVAAASPPIAGGILVKVLSKDDEEPR
jgi:hypothetical protein